MDDNQIEYYINHVLIVVKTQKQILLGYKKRGSGAGKWNCFGGKVEKYEDVKNAAIRELKEESGLTCRENDLENVATIDFSWKEKVEKHFDHVFLCENFTGDIVETEEMRPKWFDLEEIPYTQMWNSDRIWLPLVLQKKPFKGYFLYNHKGEIIESKISEGFIKNSSETQ